MKLSKKILSLVLALAMVFGVMSPVLIPASAEGETYTVTVAASPAEGGTVTVTGGGSFEYGSTATIYAQPNPGWHFIHWISGNGSIVEEQAFSFVVKENRSYTAVFEKDVVISIIPDKTEAFPGDTINYTIRIAPVSNLAKTRFKLDIPQGLNFVNLSSAEIDDLTSALMQKLNISSYVYVTISNQNKLLATSHGDYSSDSDTDIMTFSCTVASGVSGKKTIGLSECKLTDTGDSEILINTSDLKSTVNIIPPTGISLNETNLNLTEGSQSQLTATILPEGAVGTLVWSSDNTNVASVNNNGLVYAEGAGTATITVTIQNTDVSNSCTVNVSEYVCPHTSKTEIPAKAATCTEPGNNKYYKCDDCGKYLKADGTTLTTTSAESIPALGHAYPSFYESDDTQHWQVCSRCYEDSPKDNHTFGEATYTWSADNSTCTAKHTCSVCGKEVSEAVDSTSQQIPAACFTDGIIRYTATFTKPGFTAQTKETPSGQPAAHDWGEPDYEWSADNSTCTATRVCSRDSSHKEEETVNAAVTTTATCTEAGVTTYAASFDNPAFEAQEKTVAVDALGHDIIHHDGKASTCKEKGYAEYETCSRCDFTTYEELPLADHTPAAAVKENKKSPTCEKDGKYDSVVYCSVCGIEISRKTVTVKATGHKDGNNDGVCDTCKKVVDEAKHKAYLFGKVKFSVKSGEVYKNSKVTVVAKASNVPDGYFLAVFDGNKEVSRGDRTSVTYEITDLVTQDKTLTVKVVDSAGKAQKGGDGKELTAKIEIKVKTGFFDIIIAFFKKLFGSNKVTIKP